MQDLCVICQSCIFKTLETADDEAPFLPHYLFSDWSTIFMKILHIISQHPEQTGSGFYVQNIIRQCHNRGHTNHLIAGISGDRKPHVPVLPKENCTFIPFNVKGRSFPIPGMSDVMPYPSSRFSDLTTEQIKTYCDAFKNVISSVVHDFGPDLIHSHHLWFASSVTRNTCPDIPMVTSCHSTDLRQFLQHGRLRKWVTNIHKIDRILALSQNQRDEIAHAHRVESSHIDIVGGGYDTDRFRFTGKADAPPVEFLYGGKLSRAKGVPFLLRAFKNIGSSQIHLHLVGSGSGPEKDECLDLASRCGKRVTVHGPLHQLELASLMKRCHAFILPSFFEGLPLVLLEALSSGCRIVCSDLPGCRELLSGADKNTAQFIPLPLMENVDTPASGQSTRFCDNIAYATIKMTENILSKPQIRESDTSQLTKSYSWQAVFSRIENSYRKALRDVR